MRVSIFSKLVLLSFIIGSISCSTNNMYEEIEEEFPYDFIEDGNYFLRGNTLCFYYIDGYGNDLINPDDPTTLPVTYDNDEKVPTQHIIPTDYKEGLYNRNHNSVYYDEKEELYYMMSTAYGHEQQSTYTFYIGFKDEFDKMDVTYRYTDKGVIGGTYYGKIISWKFNGTHVYSDDDEQYKDEQYKKVFIIKENGRTNVAFKR